MVAGQALEGEVVEGGRGNPLSPKIRPTTNKENAAFCSKRLVEKGSKIKTPVSDLLFEQSKGILLDRKSHG